MESENAHDGVAKGVPEAYRGAKTARQWLPVDATIRERFLVSYRVRAERLGQLLPPGMTVDAYRGWGFLSVCVIDLRNMGVVHMPSWLRFDNLELLYRIGVCFEGKPAFWTLRSDVSSPWMAFLGRHFSHYRPQRGRLVQLGTERTFDLTCEPEDLPSSRFRADRHSVADQTATSVFATAEDASQFLVGMNISVGDRPDGRFSVQEIEHTPWSPTFATDVRAEFAFVGALSQRYRLEVTYDSTLYMKNILQRWGRATCR